MTAWRFLMRRASLRMADGIMVSPLLRWTWSGASREELIEGLSEFRPADRESIAEMMAGRYLLGGRLVDTGGTSPFGIPVDDPEWSDELRSFAWLRHFRESRDAGARSFARTLTLDWIGREGRFARQSWTVSLTARRTLNWLRHLTLLIDEATPEQQRTLRRSLAMQVQALKIRTRLADDPVDRLLGTIALAAVAVSDDHPTAQLPLRMRRLSRLLASEIDDDGMHLSRSPRLQVQVLTALETLRQALLRRHDDHAQAVNRSAEAMHRALAALSLSTGQPGYFNGAGQMPHDLIIALQAQSKARFPQSGTMGGYGRLASGRAVVVADGGLVPPAAYTGELNAGALAFEFSHGADLIVGNCGPAPSELRHEGHVFRRGVAQSTITIDGVSAARLRTRGALAGYVLARGASGSVAVEPGDDSLALVTHGYERRFGLTVERRLTLMSDGQTLVGQDRLVLARIRRPEATATIRFHLAPGTDIERSPDADALWLRLGSGAVWTFLWEGADMRLDDSVRHSASLGFHRTRQIVLDAPLDRTREIAWIFTLET